MPKTKISEFSSTPANNTDIDSINISEGCAPSGINDAIRELMAQLKDWQSGTSNDPMVIGSSGSLTLNQGTANGVTYLNGSKVVTSGSALVFDGTKLGVGVASPVRRLDVSGQMRATSSTVFAEVDADSSTGVGYLGTASNHPIGFKLNDSEVGRWTSTGLGIGTSSPSQKLEVAGNMYINTSGNPYLQIKTSGAGNNPYIRMQADTNYWDIQSTFSNTNDDLLFQYNGTALLDLDKNGNLGLGVTPSAWGSGSTAFQLGNGAIWKSGSRSVDWIANGYYNGTNYIYNTTNPSGFYRQQDGQHQWWNAPSGTAGNAITFTQAMTLTADGNLGIGTTSPGSNRLYITAPDGTAPLTLNSAGGSDATRALNFNVAGDNYGKILVPSGSGGAMAFWTGGANAAAERARIDSSGNLLVGATSSIASERLYLNGSNANYITRTYNSNANPYGALFSYTGAAPNGTANEFFRCDDTGAVRMTVRSNGGIANYSANNVNLSDERTKTNIQNAGGYLAKICAIPVRTFKYKDQSDDLLNLGVIAQEVETVAPELVDMSGFGETPEDGIPLKAIYQTDLQYALMKCIQEQQAIIESLKARLDAANL